MSDPTELLSASWGKIRLFCSSVNTDGGRTQVVHEPSSGDVHVVQDRGLRADRTRVQLQFDDFPGNPPPLEAALALEAAKDSGQIAMFSHPMLGRYLASIGEFHWSVDASSVISAEAEFIQEAPAEPITPVGPASGTAGEGAVSAAAQLFDEELEGVGLLKTSGPTAATLAQALPPGISFGAGLSANLSLNTSVNLTANLSIRIAANVTATARASAVATATATGSAKASASATVVATADVSASVDISVALAAAAGIDAAIGQFGAVSIDARVAVSAWSEGAVSPRQIAIDVARISANIATTIDVGGLTSDLALWPAFVAAVKLGDAVRSAAIGATSQAPSVFIMRVQDRTALLPLAARVYGGAQAQERARQIAEMNDIPTVGWLPPGDYIAPARSAAQRLR